MLNGLHNLECFLVGDRILLAFSYSLVKIDPGVVKRIFIPFALFFYKGKRTG